MAINWSVRKASIAVVLQAGSDVGAANMSVSIQFIILRNIFVRSVDLSCETNVYVFINKSVTMGLIVHHS